MRQKNRSLPIVLTGAGAGIAGFLLRLCLYRVGFDDRGLLPRMHPLHMGCLVLILAAALAGILLLKVHTLGYRPAGYLNGWGRVFLTPAIALALCAHAWSLFSVTLHPVPSPAANGFLGWARMILALAAAASTVGILWMPVRRPWVRLALHSSICLFFTLDMLCRYQYWSGNPQLPDYVLQIFACICFSLCSYSRMAHFGEIRNPRLHGISSYMSLVLGLTCAAGPETPIFYIAGACWAAAGLWLEEPSDYRFRKYQEDRT